MCVAGPGRPSSSEREKHKNENNDRARHDKFERTLAETRAARRERAPQPEITNSSYRRDSALTRRRGAAAVFRPGRRRLCSCAPQIATCCCASANNHHLSYFSRCRRLAARMDTDLVVAPPPAKSVCIIYRLEPGPITPPLPFKRCRRRRRRRRQSVSRRETYAGRVRGRRRAGIVWRMREPLAAAYCCCLLSVRVQQPQLEWRPRRL
jgi:hypothetical protein